MGHYSSKEWDKHKEQQIECIENERVVIVCSCIALAAFCVAFCELLINTDSQVTDLQCNKGIYQRCKMCNTVYPLSLIYSGDVQSVHCCILSGDTGKMLLLFWRNMAIFVIIIKYLKTIACE